MSLRFTQGDENRGEVVFDCAEKDCPMRALQAAEKFVFKVGRGFIPGINVVIHVAFRP